MFRVIGDTKVPVKIWATDLEQEAEEQVRRLADLPFIFKHVAVMPDAHAGKGSTIGTVIATRGAIIPSAVGVDIGCGMAAVKLSFSMGDLKRKTSLSDLRHSIERSVPTGRYGNKEVTDRVGKAFRELGPTMENVEDRVMTNAALQCGTLGGGNHFIEVCEDMMGGAWVVLHSGSRNIGKHLADRHIDKAKGIMKQYFIDLPDPDLAYLAQGTDEFKAYLHDLRWAQEFAKANRNEMMARILRDISFAMYGEDRVESGKMIVSHRIDCHHNYTAIENHFGSNIYVTRKGAVSAREGEYGIIPGSMGTRSYIVRGRGNADSFHSCAHGAGRRMSRTRARATFTVADLEAQTAGVECLKDNSVLDEIPGSYKDIDQVMLNQADLVDTLYTLKQVLCVKGG
jgi:tRNA-splicing ligase RtcB (3'-phosphate/5'-hydroxy nucleic acid ligase)